MVTPVKYDNRIRIQDLEEISSFDISYTYIDTSDTSQDKSLKTSIGSFAGPAKNEFINNACVRRYWTKTNELKPTDLHLFSAYAQDNTDHEKEVYFEEFPIVDAEPPLTNNEISTTQLLTKANIDDFESYLTKKHLTSYSCIPAYNWENETDYTQITSFIDLLRTLENDSRATYKFEYTTLSPDKVNVQRVTNVVPLNKLKYKNSSEITGIVHYSVAGIVAVKSDIEDQRSGTIYLEAREAGNPDADWQTIDSAVFKFIPNKPKERQYTPGTYVTLSGYLSTEFETRLKLNLKSHGYSMNLYEVRDSNYALTNHYVNTFIGFAHIPNVTSTSTNKVYFSNINYQSYLYQGKGVLLKSFSLPSGKTTMTYKVKNLLSDNDKFSIPSTTKLEISSHGMIRDDNHNPKNFVINGVRTTPTGEIYGFDSNIKVEAGMTIYPSYASGVVEAIRPRSPNLISIKGYPSAFTLENSGILENIDYSELSVLSNLSWNPETEIEGEISAELSATYDTINTKKIKGRVDTKEKHGISELSFDGTYSAADYATDKPRRQYHGKEYPFNFGTYLKNRTVEGSLITCSMHIWPSTWGSGHGNESFGRVIDGLGRIVEKGTLHTKNVSKDFTKGLCTGSRWNYRAYSSDIEFTQPTSCRSFSLWAFADTAKDDGRKETWFSVNANKILIKFHEKTTETKKIGPSEISYGKYVKYLGLLGEKANCVIGKNYVTPSEITELSVITCEHSSEISDLLMNSDFNNVSVQKLNYTKSKTMGLEYTTLTVKPYPQNLVL